MRIAICDDNKDFACNLKESVENILNQLGESNYSIDIFHSGDDLLSDSTTKDLVFLDIEMPGKNGIYVGNVLKKEHPRVIVIIITSFSEYIDDAMRFDVFRYISKPINMQRLFRNIKDAIELYKNTNYYVAIEADGELFKILSDEIIMLESIGHKVKIITEKGIFNVNDSLLNWREKLNIPSFFLSHKSFLVNIKYVDRIKDGIIFLKNGKYQAYLSRRKNIEMRKKLLLYVEKNRL